MRFADISEEDIRSKSTRENGEIQFDHKIHYDYEINFSVDIQYSIEIQCDVEKHYSLEHITI